MLWVLADYATGAGLWGKVLIGRISLLRKLQLVLVHVHVLVLEILSRKRAITPAGPYLSACISIAFQRGMSIAQQTVAFLGLDAR